MDVRSQAILSTTPFRTRHGNFLRLVACSLPVDVVFYQRGSEIGRLTQVVTGTSAKIEDANGNPRTFDSAEITTSSDQTVKYAVGFGGVDVTATAVTVAALTVIDTVADVALNVGSATQVLPADSTRRSALISNLIGNASDIRVGDSNTGAARGAQCGVGQTITLEGTEAIYAYSATAQSVGVTIIKD
jgi:hypothetical protein